MTRRLPSILVVCLFLASTASAHSVDERVSLEPGEPVRIDIAYGELQIVGSDEARLRVYGELDEGLVGVRLSRDGGAMEVRTKLPFRSSLRRLWHDEPRHFARLTIELPRDTPLFVVTREGSVRVSGLTGRLGVLSVDADVEISGELGLLTVESVSGDITFEGYAERLTAQTLGGAVRVRGGGVLAVETVDGAIEVQATEVSGKLHTVAGDVLFAGEVEQDTELLIDSDAGSVELRPGPGVQLDVLTDRGRISDRRSNGIGARPDQRSLLESTDGGLLRVRSFSADIVVDDPD